MGGAASQPEDQLVVTAVQPLPQRDSLGFADIRFQVTRHGARTMYLETCGGVVTADVQQRTTTLTWSSTPVASLCFSSDHAGPHRLEPETSVIGVQRARVTAGEYQLRIPVGPSESTASEGSAYSGPIRIP